MRNVPRRLAWAIGLAVVAITAIVVARRVDAEALGVAGRAAIRDPVGLALALGGFGVAFVLRSWAWRRVPPRLGLGQAWSAIHLSLAANHLLPLRLGEAVRPLAAHRRTGVPLAHLGASTLTLRAADILALGALAAALAPGAVGEVSGPWGWAVLVAVAGAGVIGSRWLWRLRRTGAAGREGPVVGEAPPGGTGVTGWAGETGWAGWAGWAGATGAPAPVGAGRPGRTTLRLPGPAIAMSATGAWLFEAVLVHRCAAWAGHPISARNALLVTVAAVGAQVAAIAPGGIGTYEAAATAALVTAGVPARTGLAVAVVAHALKTAYALVAGAIALCWPAPSLWGRLRLPRHSRAQPGSSAGPGPVYLVLPADDEAPRIAAVIERLPATIAGRPTVCLVIDDGSGDGTAAVARTAGAAVVTHETNLGLGASVRRGLAEAVERGAAVVAFCDADGEYSPAELPRLVEPILAGRADYVVGSRFRGGPRAMRPHRHLGNRLLTAWLRWVSRTPLSDGQSGFRALSRQAASTAQIAHDYNYAQVLTLDLLARGFRYAEVPISYRFRVSGRSFVRPLAYLRAVVPAVHRQLNGPPPTAPDPQVAALAGAGAGAGGRSLAAAGGEGGAVRTHLVRVADPPAHPSRR